MASPFIRALDVLAAIADDEDFLRFRLAVLRALEVSLDCSREALLELDLAGIERATADQIVLIRELRATWGNATERLAEDRTAAEREVDFELSGELKEEIKQEIRRSAQRILQALQLQAALLARENGKLRVLANMLAGPGVPYGDWLARRGSEEARVAPPATGRR
jgi:hypothetical protein